MLEMISMSTKLHERMYEMVCIKRKAKILDMHMH